MSGRLSFEVERRLPVFTVRLSGVLDAYTAADLRAVLLGCLAEQPAGVVIDATRMSVTDDIGLAVLAGVAQQSERWPGTRFAMFATGPPSDDGRAADTSVNGFGTGFGASTGFAAAVERMGVTRHVRLCPDGQAAMKEANQWPVPPSARQRIAPDSNAPSVARGAVHDFCAAQGIGGDGDAAQLVASELVTNAVVHAGTTIDLTLRLVSPHLHIAVRDGGDGQARIGGIIDESSESGRGLLLVDALATAWDTFLPDVGKVVWATVRVKPLDRTA